MPEHHYIEPGICNTKTFGAWSVKEVSDLKHFSVASIRECAGRCEDVLSGFLLQREGRGVVSIPVIVVIGSWSHYLPSCSTDSAALDKIALKEMTTVN